MTNIQIPFDSDQAGQARALLGAASELGLPVDAIRVSGRGFRVPEEVFESYMEVVHGDSKVAEDETVVEDETKTEDETPPAPAEEKPKPAPKKAPAKKTAAKKSASAKPSLDDVLGDTEE